MLSVDFEKKGFGFKKRQCLAKLLKVVNFFSICIETFIMKVTVVASDMLNESVLPAKLDVDSTISKLMHIVRTSAESPIGGLSCDVHNFPT